MGEIKLLDCTLRDGGYINNWEFGEEAIREISRVLAWDVGVDAVELGFLKDEPYRVDRAIYNSMGNLKDMIYPKKKETLYTAMISLGSPFPIENLEPAGPDTADAIRVIVWRTMTLPDGRIVDAIDDAADYCRKIVEKGYKLFVQPSWVHRYSAEEYIRLIERFNQLSPYAFYVVDSSGSQSYKTLKPYFDLADQYLNPEIILGYHGHNNFSQVLQIAQQFVTAGFFHNLFVDASIFGMGQGAGNLCLELFAKFLNEEFDRRIDITRILALYEKYIKRFYEKFGWGYSIPAYVAGVTKTHVNYIHVFQEYGLSAVQMQELLKAMPDNTRMAYSRKNAERAVKEYLEKKSLGGVRE